MGYRFHKIRYIHINPDFPLLRSCRQQRLPEAFLVDVGVQSNYRCRYVSADPLKSSTPIDATIEIEAEIGGWQRPIIGTPKGSLGRVNERLSYHEVLDSNANNIVVRGFERIKAKPKLVVQATLGSRGSMAYWLVVGL